MSDSTAAYQRVLDYHAATTHRIGGYAPSPGFLDWDAQPDPFRRFMGAPTIELPFAPPDCGQSYDNLYDETQQPGATPDLAGLGHMLELAFGLSAWKVAGPDRWALRNNPSSGNLHPTEAYVVLWAENLDAGVYHYDALNHVLEQRCAFDTALAGAFRAACPGSFGALALTTITWREEWKYGARAYRYCQLDLGHALGAARFGAATLGWRLALASDIGDEQLADLLGVNRVDDFADAERELPDLLCLLGDAPTSPHIWDALSAAARAQVWHGQANTLSAERVQWPQIKKLLPATFKPATGAPAAWTPSPAAPTQSGGGGLDAAHLIRTRRSAQRMDKDASRMTRADFFALLARTLPRRDGAPFDVYPYAPTISLVLYVHGVEGLEPGLYALVRAPAHLAQLKTDMNPDFAWEPVADCPAPLYALDAPRDCRKPASQMSCHQGIAGHGAFAISMLADFTVTLNDEGPWAYRRLHWEAGLIGQVLYLEAQNRGLSGTGIGCYFDEEVAAFLGMDATEARWKTLYHFTVGKARTDDRIQTEPAYGHLARWSQEQGIVK